MKLLISTEHRFISARTGSVWTQTAFRYAFWQRYCSVFHSVAVFARVQEVDEPPPGYVRADGPGVSFVALPHYIGPVRYLSRWLTIRRTAARALADPTAVILRVPSVIANHLAGILWRRRQPYGVEVVGDPYDVFAPGVVEHPLRPFFRWSFCRALRLQCAGACAAAYVTAEALQLRYHPGGPAFHISDVDLTDDHSYTENGNRTLVTSLPSVETLEPFRSARCPIARPPDAPIHIATIGSLEQLYKGTDTLIDALAHCLASGANIDLTIIGDGKYRRRLETYAVRQGIRERVRFMGQLPSGAVVRQHLRAADLFVLPSRTEGLPRAMLEAMAEGLPCLGSQVGGIPELLVAEDTVPPNNPEALAGKILEVIRDPSRLTAMSVRAHSKIREFAEPVLRLRRDRYLHHLHDATMNWLKSESRCVSST